MHEVQLKLKVIKKHQKFKNPTTVCFLLMDSLGRVEAKQKQNGNYLSTSTTSPHQWCRSLLIIGGDNLKFYPNFSLISTLGGMNFDHDFFQVWKFSKDQKTMQMEHFFPKIQVKTKKKSSSSNIEHFFPKFR